MAEPRQAGAAVAVSILGLVGQIALSLGGYRNRLLANALWIVVGLGVLWLAWSVLPARFRESRLGESVARFLRGIRTWDSFILVQHGTSPQLFLQSRGEKPRRVDGLECRVWDEYGNCVAWRRPPEMGWRIDQEVLSYPSAFALAHRPIRSGTFSVEWRKFRRFSRLRRRTFSRSKFTIAPGLPGWWVRFDPIYVGAEDQVTIFLHNETGKDGLRGLVCEVVDPQGKRFKHGVESRRDETSPVPLLEAQVTYPAMFDGASGLTEGIYTGRWTAWSPDAPVGASGRRILVREFRLNWPDPNAHRFEEHR